MKEKQVLVRCPSCAGEFTLSDAVLGSVRSDVAAEMQTELAKRESELESKMTAAAEQFALLKKQKAELEVTVQDQVETRLRRERDEIRIKAESKAAADQETALKALREEATARAAALLKAQETELALRREKREIEESRDALKLEVERTLDAERGKLKESAKAQADEENRFKIMEKEAVINDLIRKLEEAQRKAEQGSQQLQGEILETDFEEQLRRAFPHDTVAEIAKGQRGGDLSQEVFNKTGKRCGLILYENKRTKNWSDAWIPKLKEDMARVNADLGVIVTEAMPPLTECFCQRDEVWVTDFKSAIPLAHVLRCILHEVSVARGFHEGAKEKMELLYSYFTGHEFRQRISLMIGAFTSMRTDLDRERRSLSKAWSKREKQINSVIENMAGMIGDVQGLSGNALEEIPSLELDSDDDPAEDLLPGEGAAE